MKSILLTAATLLASGLAKHQVVVKDNEYFYSCSSWDVKTCDIVIHSFSKSDEARAYVGDHLTNTKVEKWGVERIFGEERKTILVIPETQNVVPIRYKVTVGPKTGQIYWQNTDFNGHGNGLIMNNKKIANNQTWEMNVQVINKWNEQTGTILKTPEKGETMVQVELTDGGINWFPIDSLEMIGGESSEAQYMDVPYHGRNHARTGGELLFNWIFGLVDDDESGTIDEGEVKENIFKKMDANNDQKVDATDFDLLKAKDVFQLLDEDNSGFISASELPVDLIENIEKSGNDPDWLEDDSDANNDKRITLEEFEAMYTLKLKWEEKLKKSGSGVAAPMTPESALKAIGVKVHSVEL